MKKNKNENVKDIVVEETESTAKAVSSKRARFKNLGIFALPFVSARIFLARIGSFLLYHKLREIQVKPL